MPVNRLASFSFIACTLVQTCLARDIRLTIPGHSTLTPVQKLNRDGVDAILKHQYDKAEVCFNKAYLFDPADPFTLNNLGYVAELQGQVDRAEKLYKLAADQGSQATIERSNAKELKGKPMMVALGLSKSGPLRVNRLNVQGAELLLQDRGYEAAATLKEALALDPHNAFTLNDLGVAEEATGNFEDALKHYDEAASTGSKEAVVITPKRSWKGKPISEMAASSAYDLRRRMQKTTIAQARAAMLAMRGVAATNRNDWPAARKDFLEAYSLNPLSAFALNNLGYVAERDGDPETAQFYYSKAQKAEDAGSRIGLATGPAAQGERLSAVAGQNVETASSELEAYSQKRRGQPGQTRLKTRNGQSPDPEAPPAASPDTPAPPSPPPATKPSPQ